MSAAWQGYRDHRRGGRRWLFALAAGLLIAAAVWLGTGRGLPQTSPLNSHATAAVGDPASAALILYNENDPASRELAAFYADKRGIGYDRIVGLKCPTAEEISRQEYDDTIANPLRGIFDARGWWTRSPDHADAEPSSIVTGNRIRFLVLMRGIPLKIKPTSGYSGDFCHQPSPIRDQNAASVDSELAALGLFTRSISGIVPNPFYRSFNRFPETAPPGVMLTGRLDGPTDAVVRRMIVDSLAAEKTGLWGRCYVDGRGFAPNSNPLAEGDTWLTKIATDYAPYTLPTIFDQRPQVFSTPYPMEDAALYFGWYNEQVVGPFTREDFHFRPGAVACHIHSFSATSVRDPSRWWVGPLLNRGAAAALGNVYEPYLTLTTHLDIFAERLFDGYTLAESAWESTPALSWMNTVVGDPLYRPGKVWKDLDFDLNSSDPPPPGQPAAVSEGRAYLDGARRWRASGPVAGAAALEKSGSQWHSGRIFEGLGLLQASVGDTTRACAAFEQAARYYKEPADEVRVVLQEARLLAAKGKKTRAVALLATARQRYAGCPALPCLDELAGEISSEKP